MKRFKIIAVLFLLGIGHSVSAQVFGVKTNALYWLSTTPNIGVEAGIGKHFTIELTGGYNPWLLDGGEQDNRKFKHFLISPEVRYWFCDTFQGHFIGLNLPYAQYNISNIYIPFIDKSRNSRYQGWAIGAGITYGYSWIIGKRWNMEATLGLGYVYTEYDKYENRKCGLYHGSAQKHLFAPTSLGLSFIYLIK